jgi:hypothetical protein
MSATATSKRTREKGLPLLRMLGGSRRGATPLSSALTWPIKQTLAVYSITYILEDQPKLKELVGAIISFHTQHQHDEVNFLCRGHRAHC